MPHVHDPDDPIDSIKTRQDLVKFVTTLAQVVAKPPGSRPFEIENTDLESYLEAMSGWIGDMHGWYQNADRPWNETPSWQDVARMLRAALYYS